MGSPSAISDSICIFMKWQEYFLYAKKIKIILYSLLVSVPHSVQRIVLDLNGVIYLAVNGTVTSLPVFI